MTRRDHPELKCTRCGVSVKEEHIPAPNRCPSGDRCPLNRMVAEKAAQAASIGKDRAA